MVLGTMGFKGSALIVNIGHNILFRGFLLVFVGYCFGF